MGIVFRPGIGGRADWAATVDGKRAFFLKRSYNPRRSISTVWDSRSEAATPPYLQLVVFRARACRVLMMLMLMDLVNVNVSVVECDCDCECECAGAGCLSQVYKWPMHNQPQVTGGSYFPF